MSDGKEVLNRPVFGECAPRGVWRILFALMRLRLLGGRPRRTALKRWRDKRGDAPVDAKIRGVKYRPFPHDSFVERAIFRFPWKYEPRELRTITDAVSGGGVFLDIGANIGHFAPHAARAGAERVLAFEPNPAVFSRLRVNIALNDFGEKVEAVPLALGEAEGRARLAYGHKTDLASIVTPDGGSEFEVRVAPLLEVLRESGISSIAAMKIDVEGSEDRILSPFFAAAPRGLWPKVLVMERNQGGWKEDILSAALSLGYRRTDETRLNVMMVLP